MCHKIQYDKKSKIFTKFQRNKPYLAIKIFTRLEMKIFGCHIGCVGKMSEEVLETNKKQIT